MRHGAAMTIPALLKSPADVVSAVPALLGFMPHESIVTVSLLSNNNVGLVARVDLPRAALCPESVASLADALVRQRDAQRVIVLCYSAARPEPAYDKILPLVNALGSRGLTVSDCLWSDGLRWRSMWCDDPECCPDEGREIDQERARQVGGLLGAATPAANREALVSELAPASTTRRRAMESVLRGLTMPCDGERDIAIAHAVETFVSPASGARDHASGASDHASDARDTGLALMSLRDVAVRDTVLWDLLSLGPESWAAAVPRLSTLVSEAPVEHLAPGATLLAILRWQMGDGTRASIAIDRALQAESTYSLAQLISCALEAGLPPHEWRAGVLEMPRETCRQVHLYP